MYRTIMEGGILKITKPTRDLKFWLKAKVCQPVYMFTFSYYRCSIISKVPDNALVYLMTLK